MSKNQVPNTPRRPATDSRPEIRNVPGSRQPSTSSGASLTSIRPPKK